MGNLSRLLKESWTLVEEQQDKVAGYFYARIFLSQPASAGPLPGAHGRAARAAARRDRHGRADARRPGAVRRVPAGARPRPPQVPRGAGALRRSSAARCMEALRTFAGEQWSIEYDQAWGDAYAVIAKKMLAGAEADTNPPYWHAEVLAHERRGRDIAVFTVPPAAAPLEYRAGQYVSVECPRYQPRLWRTYSIGERAAQGQHARVPRAGARRRLGVQRAGPPGQGRRHDPAGRADGLDDARPRARPATSCASPAAPGSPRSRRWSRS